MAWTTLPGMSRRAVAGIAVLLLALAGLAGGCGGGGAKSSASSSPSGGGAQAGALSAEATSAATGDIPDNQVFLVFRDRAAGYSVKYPEGWTQRGRAGDVTFQDKNNLIHVVVGTGGAPTVRGVQAALTTRQGSAQSLRAGPASVMALKGAGQAVKVTYTTESAPNPVTGRRVQLTVDRYVVARGGRQAILDLGTPRGVDNVDAYRLIAQSFRWS